VQSDSSLGPPAGSDRTAAGHTSEAGARARERGGGIRGQKRLLNDPEKGEGSQLKLLCVLV